MIFFLFVKDMEEVYQPGVTEWLTSDEPDTILQDRKITNDISCEEIPATPR